MIKVNLLNNKVSPASPDAQFNMPLESTGGGGDLEGGADEKEALVNFGLILLFALLIFAYEKYSTGELKEKQQQAMVRYQQVNRQLQEKQREVEKVSTFEEQAKELENKLSIIESLSQSRLRAVKALDFLQNLVPERTWLETVTFENERFVVEGSAVSDDDLTELQRRLERSQYFSNVVILKAKETETDTGKITSFEISCNVGSST